MRRITWTAFALTPALLLACAHGRTPAQEAMVKRGDCAELLLSADAARASGETEVASGLAAGCAQDKLEALVARSSPEQGLLWCGRAAAARQKGCEARMVAGLASRLNPAVTIGPPDESTPLDPLLGAALSELGKELNLSWSDDPDVIVGKLTVSLDHTTAPGTAAVADATGKKVRIAAMQHRYVAKAEAEVELGSKTRMLRAQEEARDYTWDGSAQKAVPARATPDVPAPAELKRRAVVAWVRALAKALAADPPEGVDVNDARGCVAYGLSINLNTGDPGAAARGVGDAAKVAACEKLLGEPAGAGIPVP